jgi:hypothetical protein
VAKLVDKWLELHAGERFDLDIICRQLEISEREHRNDVAEKLWYEAKHGNLEKNDRIYTIINKDIKIIDWQSASAADAINVKFPVSHYDESCFEFGEYLVTRPGDLWVVAGVSNKGKSCLVRNLLWDNMDSMKCRMMVSEYAPGRFKSVVSRMTWANPLKADGTPKFDLIERHGDWRYAIDPDALNIIDWIGLGDNFWEIRNVMEGIQETLRGGIAVIVLQKNEGKTLGEGGAFSEQRASVYINIDSGILTVRKIKETRHNRYFDGCTYGFDIIDSGSGISNIREVKKCVLCSGKGARYTKDGEVKCIDCLGSGWKDK